LGGIFIIKKLPKVNYHPIFAQSGHPGSDSVQDRGGEKQRRVLSQIVMQKAGGTAFDLLFSFRSEAK
jgi:hypothetical protein